MDKRMIYRFIGLLAMLSLFLSNSLLVPLRTVRASPQSSTKSILLPLADTYVRESYPDTNYGTTSDLRAGNSLSMHSYLRFSVGAVPTGLVILKARLKVYVNNNSAYGLKARRVSNDAWGEDTLTYNNMPSVGTAISLSPAVTAGTWVVMNVTSYVKTAGIYSFAVVTPGSKAISFASRESGAHSPQLVVIVGLPDVQPSFPVRAAFYYPWFPEAWNQRGIDPYTNFTPSLGYYSSRDSTILKRHIDMMQYANIQVGLASWWGQGSQTDSKISGLLSAAAGTPFRWGLYYEAESYGDPSAAQIQSDLIYIRDHYGRDTSFFRVNGRFVVFVYASTGDGCGMADRWKQGNTVGAYVVLKVFPGYANCASQPNSWHQYSPALATSQQGNLSFSISPGFWQKGYGVRLGRDITRWTQNVKDMVASGAKWQLVTTFSEWGEGTAVESAQEWSSASSDGQYLDALHYNGNMP